MTPDIRMRITQLRNGIVPEGYKRTRHGVLPKDWQIHIIEECLEQVSSPVDVEADTMYTQIGIRSHGKGLFYKEAVSGEALGNKSVFWIEPNCFVLNIVFAWEQAIGKTTQNEVGMIGSHRFPMYRPIEGKVDIDYLIYYLLTKRGTDILEAASPGGAGRNRTLGQERFMKSRLPLPPLPEQQKIAAFLAAQDKVIELKEKRLAEKQRQKKYLMQQLLTGKKRLDGFSDESTGRWHMRKIGECIKEYKEFSNDISRIPVYSSSRKGLILQADYYDQKEAVETNLGYKVVPRGYVTYRHMSDDDIFHFNVNTTGGDILVSSEYPVFTSTSDCDLGFLIPSLNDMSKFRYFCRIQKLGGTRTRLYVENLKKYSLLIPPIKEQKAISVVLSTADHEIEFLQRDLDQEKQKKKALMQLLLTGIVRVKV